VAEATRSTPAAWRNRIVGHGDVNRTTGHVVDGHLRDAGSLREAESRRYGVSRTERH
jgi:hypothetical protein